MKMAKRSFCGEFKKPDHPFKSSAFKGKHSRTTSPDAVSVDQSVDPATGKKKDGSATSGKPQTGGASPGQVVRPPPPARPQTPPPAAGGGGVDPEAYDPGANVNPTPDPSGGAGAPP
jgi:hypothetical protein